MAAGLSMIGGMVQAAGAMQAAEAEAKAHEYNAAVAVRNREVIRDQTIVGALERHRLNWREMSAIKGKFAANGVGTTGSALDVMRDTSIEHALSVQRVEYAGELLEIEQIDDMNLELMAADAARQAGKISAAAAIIGGLSGALSSMG